MSRCWTDYLDWCEKTYGPNSEQEAETYFTGNKTCLLPQGHEGPHEWTPDEEILVAFKPMPKEAGNDQEAEATHH